MFFNLQQNDKNLQQIPIVLETALFYNKRDNRVLSVFILCKKGEKKMKLDYETLKLSVERLHNADVLTESPVPEDTAEDIDWEE